MKVYRPVKSVGINQKFGESLACVKLNEAGVAIRPFQVVTKTSESCPAQHIDFYHAIGMKGHNGWDNKSYHGEPLYFPVDIPNVSWSATTEFDNDGGIGLDVFSNHRVNLNGKEEYIKFRFWHLKSCAVKTGDPVYPGQLIGYCDNTGASSGDHLHWSMKIVNEMGDTLNRDNGYTGAVDFEPWYEDVFILDVVSIKAQAIQAIQKAKSLIQQILVFVNNKKHPK